MLSLGLLLRLVLLSAAIPGAWPSPPFTALDDSSMFFFTLSCEDADAQTGCGRALASKRWAFLDAVTAQMEGGPRPSSQPSKLQMVLLLPRHLPL